MSEPADVLYPWKRFWCPSDKQISFADDGFVYDPESEYGIVLNPDLITLDATADLPCVILLGDPGLGKSEALREHCAALGSGKNSSCRVMFVDLKNFGSDTVLTRAIFESEKFKAWKKGDGRLYLLLDSFDEGLLTIEALSGYLARELRTLTDVESTLTARMESSTSFDASEANQDLDP